MTSKYTQEYWSPYPFIEKIATGHDQVILKDNKKNSIVGVKKSYHRYHEYNL